MEESGFDVYEFILDLTQSGKGKFQIKKTSESNDVIAERINLATGENVWYRPCVAFYYPGTIVRLSMN